VHGDLFRDNVLFSSAHSDRIAALLDFESAHEGPFVFDLAVTILSWSFRDDFELPVARAIVSGYRSVRTLDLEESAAFFDEAVLACLRFTVTRITDDAIRVGKRWQRFVQRRLALEAMGPDGVREAFGL
jgi:homoserine kinase type II